MIDALHSKKLSVEKRKQILITKVNETDEKISHLKDVKKKIAAMKSEIGKKLIKNCSKYVPVLSGIIKLQSAFQITYFYVIDFY